MCTFNTVFILSIAATLMAPNNVLADVRFRCETDDPVVYRAQFLQTVRGELGYLNTPQNIEVYRTDNQTLENYCRTGTEVRFVTNDPANGERQRFDVTGVNTHKIMQNFYFLVVPLTPPKTVNETFEAWLEIHFGAGSSGWWNVHLECLITSVD